MKKLVLTAVAVVTALACAAVAFAQTPPTLTVTGKVTPLQVGTKAKPKGGQLNIEFQVNEESRTTIDRITYTIPSGIKLDGTGFPTCSQDTLANEGPGACPPKSKIGTGSADALILGPQPTPLDFQVTIFVGGPKTLTLYLETQLFNLPIEGRIEGNKLIVEIPERVYRPVGNTYSSVTRVDATLGKAAVTTGSGAKKKTRNYVSLIGCKNKKHKTGVELHSIPNNEPVQQENISATDTAPCKKAATRR